VLGQFQTENNYNGTLQKGHMRQFTLGLLIGSCKLGSAYRPL